MRCPCVPVSDVNIDKWWENKLGIQGSTVDVQDSESNSRSSSPATVQIESKMSGGAGPKDSRKRGGLHMGAVARMKKKAASLFKTLNGQIKLKGSLLILVVVVVVVAVVASSTATISQC